MATGGSTAALPINVSLTNIAGQTSPRQVTAKANAGSVSITSSGDLPVKTITALGDVTQGQGSVTLAASTNITGVDSSSYIRANRVSLTATNGSIGSAVAGAALEVDTGFTSDPALRPFGDPAKGVVPKYYYGLSAFSSGDINIVSKSWAAPSAGGHAQGNADGTILANQIVSTGGNVRLTTAGQVLDNNPVEQIDQRTYQQLVGYWNSLGLVAGTQANADKQAATVAAYQQGQTQQYQQYWQMRQMQADHGASYDANFQISYAPGTSQYLALQKYYTDQETAKNNGVAPANLSTLVAADISAFAASQTQLYHQLNASVGGYTSTYQANFQYTASANEAAQLTAGAAWTENELGFSLSAGILKTITDTNPVVKAPNVSGRTVTILADKGVGETVNAASAQPGITILPTNDPAKTLTDAQKVAMATAERSDLVLTVGGIILPANPTPAQLAAYQAAQALGILNTAVQIPLGAKPSDMTPAQQAALQAAAVGLADKTGNRTYLSVLSKRPLNVAVAPTGSLNVTVTVPTSSTLDVGDAYLASAGNVQVGAISVTGETRVLAKGSITDATPNSTITTGNIVLEAANGAIGSPANNPLTLELRPSATITARAQNGVYLLTQSVAGIGSLDANVDTIYSPNVVKLEAKGSIFNANGDNELNILGQAVLLTADTGSIGTFTNRLNVGTNPTGVITATAQFGNVDLYGPAGVSFNIGGVTAGLSAALSAAGDATILGAVVSNGDTVLTSAGTFYVTSTGSVLSTAGMISGNMGALQMLNGATMVAASGSINLATTGDALVTALLAGTSASVTAGGHILAGTDPLRAYDISADSIKLLAGLGIGDETEANDAIAKPPVVTTVANPLILKTNALEATATSGDIDLTVATALKQARLLALNGSINMTVAGPSPPSRSKPIMATSS